MNVWVLTREINEYDQDGAYFEEVFKDYPTKAKLMKAGVDEEHADHLLSGNSGRISREDEWWYLEELPVK